LNDCCHVVLTSLSRLSIILRSELEVVQKMVERISDRPWELSDLFPEDSRRLLASLGWDSVPSREQTYREIEERLLLPKERLPEDWLSKYQVWVHHAILPIHDLTSLQDTGMSRFQYLPYCRPSLLRLRLVYRLLGPASTDM